LIFLYISMSISLYGLKFGWHRYQGVELDQESSGLASLNAGVSYMDEQYFPLDLAKFIRAGWPSFIRQLRRPCNSVTWTNFDTVILRWRISSTSPFALPNNTTRIRLFAVCPVVCRVLFVRHTAKRSFAMCTHDKDLANSSFAVCFILARGKVIIFFSSHLEIFYALHIQHLILHPKTW